MIFVCVGSREYPFDRLLKKLDELVEQGAIRDTVFAQIGQSNYAPKYYACRRYIPAAEFNRYQQEADLIISHGGTGALISALKLGKQVIAIPRLAKYGEHMDDHQMQVCGMLAAEGYIRQILDIEELGAVLQQCINAPAARKYNKPSHVASMVEEYINLTRERGLGR
ncbi:MAG: PssE/Cps14G family polysaccharide biosynthesis glycosyltransferase [Christensenellales bacterium]